MKYIYIIDENDELKDKLEKSFKVEKEIRIKKVLPDKYESALKNIPDILVINEDVINNDILKENVTSYCHKLRSDEDNLITPIIVLSSNSDKNHIIDILKNDVELYLKQPVDVDILYYSIKNLLRLLDSNRMVSPLTGLPGNVKIQAEMKKRLLNGTTYAMLYIDLDNFKAYNDIYGFSNGDEIIKFTANTISSNVFKEDDGESNFVGHIGGDDFIAIVEGDDYEKICQDIITEFEAKLPKFFNKEDFERGYLEVENRKGIMEEYPLTSISIGVVEVNKERFKNTLEIGEAGANVKHLAKTIYGSTYVIDRRKNRDECFERAEHKKIEN